MNCKKTRTRLLDYIEGNLDPTSSKQTEEHLLSCSDCRGFHEEMQHFNHLMLLEKNTSSNPFLTNRIMEAVKDQQVTPQNSRGWSLSKHAAAAAIVLLIAGGIMGGLQIGDLITSELSSSQEEHAEISSLLNEMGHEPLEQMLFNYNNSAR